MNNTLFAIVLGAIAIYVGYTFYARRIDRAVIQSSPSKATPAKLYMDGVDFVPTSRNILYGYHFKSIAAAGPIVGAITAGALWGWVPSIIWLVLGVVFMGWASDYSAIVVSVRNEGNSLSATAHRLIAPRTRQILLLFIFFYLLLVAGAFGNIVAGVLNDPRVPLGIVALAVLGVLGGQMLYKMRSDLVLVTVITVGGTLLAVLLNADANGPVASGWKSFNGALNSVAPNGITTVLDPTRAAEQQNVPISVSFLFWLIALFAFCYMGAILPIWRYAQPVNYIGFWITALTIVLGGLGAFLAFFLRPDFATFKLAGFIGFNGPPQVAASGAIQPLWPMLFVTIACGAISGWHALIGSVGTARQIENETDMLPVGGGAMFSEFALGLLSLLALATAAQPASGAAMFAAGIGGFLNVFQIPVEYGTAIGFAAFVVIVITVVQLVFRVMRVTLAEGLGDRHPIWRNMHFSTLISMAATFLLVVTGTWVYIWQLFGAANQLMASLSLLVVTVWLAASRRNPTYAAIPTLFMYVTTMAATLVTAYNLYATVFLKQIGQPGHEIAVIGSLLTIAIAIVLFIAAVFIGIDGIRAFQRYREAPLEAVPAPGAASA
ncbi:MAG TPA: carbon starvation CstA family protein [Chloroflexota bacterium]|jgi:carbon starvation protein|nr:carbon starvation CstA family protein [Chloroflexota bacterium]